MKPIFCREQLEPPPIGSRYFPSWRWTAITELVDGNPTEYPRIARHADDWIRRGYQFRLAQLAAETPAEHYKVGLLYPDLAEAHALVTDRLIIRDRWAMEALIMTGESSDVIASHIGQSVDVINAFEAVFFDVRRILPYKVFVLNRLAAPAMDSRAIDDPDSMFKLIGYLGGLSLFMKFLDTFNSLSPEEWERVNLAIRQRVAKNALMAAVATTPNRYNAVELQTLHREFQDSVVKNRELTATDGGTETWVRSVLAAANAMLGDSLTLESSPGPGRYVEPRPLLTAATP